MNNTQKSFKGAPTTNLTPNLGIVGIQAAPTVVYVGVEDGWKKYSLNGTWTAGTYPYSIGIDGVSFTGGVTYSSGVFIKTSVPGKFATLFTGMNYVNEPMNNAGTSFSIPQSDGSLFVGRTGFQYTSTTSQTGYILSQPVVGQVFSSATDFIYIKNGQVEVGSFPTPFTSGTRSNTQAILDLTNLNTITANNLTYANNNTFSFDGVDDYLDCGSTIQLTNNFTLEVWHKNINTGHVIDQGNLGVDPNGSLEFTNRGLTLSLNNIESVTAVGTITNTSGWNSVTCSFASGSVNFYINGNYDSTRTMTSTAFTPSGILKIGRRALNNTVIMSGELSVVKIYNRVLTSVEVSQNFNALRGRYGI
jgi:hypothetical protein